MKAGFFMHGYIQLEHTADIAIEIYADSIVNLFHAGLDAWLDLSLSGIDFIPTVKQNYESSGNSFEELLIKFLGEINFQLHVNKIIFNEINSIDLSVNNGEYFLQSELTGEEIDFNKFYIKEEIKAVTFHQVKIQQREDLFTTKIVFDI